MGSNVRAEIVGRRVANKWVPTIEQILDCATREQYLDQTEEGKALFAYYWDVLLMKVVGKKHWDKPFRHYKTIGEAVHDDRQDDAACITPGTEAFLYLLFDNCEQKWIHLADEKRQGNMTPRMTTVRSLLSTRTQASRSGVVGALLVASVMSSLRAK